MEQFVYVAIRESGKQVEGVIEAHSIQDVESILVNRNLIPVKVRLGTTKGTAKRLNLQAFQTVPKRDLILFTRQFSIMVRCGVPMLRMLDVLEEQTECKLLKNSIGMISNDIQNGSDLVSAFRRQSKVFSPLYCGMVNAGENSGQLDLVMDHITAVIEHEYKIQRDIKTALRYPSMVLSFLLVSFYVLMSYVIPKFSSIFKNAKIELPMPTKICITLSDYFRDNSTFIMGGVVISALVLCAALRTDYGKYYRDLLLIRAPLIGPLVTKSIMSRFSSIFAILITSGVDILQSVNILRQTLNNKVIEKEFNTIEEHLRGGDGISSPLRDSRYFPNLLSCICAIGEETGEMDTLLEEVSHHYDIEVKMAIEKLNDAIPVILTISLAGIIGFFALAIYMPMWDLTQMIRK